jgi:hypothetical protein
LKGRRLPDRVSVPGHVGVLAIVWVASVAYVWTLLDRGWVPHDEGTLGQSALRVLRGEIPHRDFEDIYTGGLTYLNALSFALWGVRLMAMRYMAFLAFACWIPVVYYLASRWERPAAAALLTLTAVAWSYPNYTAAMPSWYMLYCATGTVACLTRYLEVRRVRWLVAAGALAGISCLFKIVGLYVVAGAMLFLVYLEQRSRAGGPNQETVAGSNPPWYRLATTAGLVGFGASVYLLVRPRLGLPEFVQFVLPSWTSIAFLLANEWSMRRGNDTRRFRTILGLLGPFAAGLALPVLAMLAYFLVQGGLDDLLAGVLVKPFRRLTTAALRPLPASALLATALVATVLVFGERLAVASKRRATIALGGLAVLLLVLGGLPGVGQVGYLSISQSVPVIVVASALILWNRPRPDALAGMAPERLALLAFMCATYTLVQYPFSTPTYFTFIAPLVILAAASVITGFSSPGGPRLAILLAFYICYAVLWVTPRQFRVHNSAGLLREAEVRTLLPGLADLRVSRSHWLEYESLMPLIAQNARGDYIFSGPDSPEVYFLSGRSNPTRTLFDFLDDQEGRTARILDTIDRRGVRLVVINDHPYLSAPLDPQLARALRLRYPNDSVIGHFTVRWN